MDDPVQKLMQVCRVMMRRVRRRCLLVVLGSVELRRSRRTMWRLLEADSNVHPRRRRRRPTRSNNRDQSVSAARVVAAQWLLSRQCRVQPDPLAQPLCPCCCCRCEAGGRDCCCCLFVVLRYSASMTTLGPHAGTPPPPTTTTSTTTTTSSSSSSRSRMPSSQYLISTT